MNFYLLDVEYKKLFRSNTIKKIAVQAKDEEQAKKIYKVLHNSKKGIVNVVLITFTEFLEYSRK